MSKTSSWALVRYLISFAGVRVWGSAIGFRHKGLGSQEVGFRALLLSVYNLILGVGKVEHVACEGVGAV